MGLWSVPCNFCEILGAEEGIWLWYREHDWYKESNEDWTGKGKIDNFQWR